MSTDPSPLICAKSLILRNNELAILGVPLLLPATSIAASIEILTSRIFELLSIIVDKIFEE